MNAGGRLLEILLVEDNPGDVRLLCEALSESGAGMRLRVARDGEEALALLGRAPSARPDLVLLDLNLPRMGGLAVLGALKRDPGLRSIPVLVLTSSSADRDVRASYDLQAAGYIVKPVGVERYADLLRTIERFWGCLVTLPPAAAPCGPAL